MFNINVLCSLLILRGFLGLSSAQTEAEEATLPVAVYDIFGFETTIIEYGGFAEIICQVPQHNVCDHSLRLIDPNGRVVSVANEKCNLLAKMRLNITSATIFGKYRCKLKNRILPGYASIQYRTCSSLEVVSAEIRHQCLDSARFCIVDRDPAEINYCLELPEENWCSPDIRVAKGHLCPSKANSFCEAIGNYETSYAVVFGVCPGNDSEVPFVQYDSIRRFYNEPIRIQRSQRIIRLSSTADSFLTGSILRCTVVDKHGTIVDKLQQHVAGLLDFYLVDHVFDQGSQIFKLHCVFKKQTVDLAVLSSYLIVQGGNVGINEEKDMNNYTQTLQCELSPSPSSDFILEYFWILKGSDGVLGDATKLSVFQSGEYECAIKQIYKTGIPQRSGGFEPLRASFVAMVDPKRQTTPLPFTFTNNVTTPQVTRKSLADWEIILIVGAVLFVVAVISAIAVRKIRKRRQVQEQQRRQRLIQRAYEIESPDLREMMLKEGQEKLQQLANDPSAMNLVQLKAWCKYKRKMCRSHQLDDEMVEFETSAKLDERWQTLKSMHHARYGPIFLDTMVEVSLVHFAEDGRRRWTKHPMPVSRVSDWHGAPILIGEAPSESEVFRQWQMILEENVGTIAWIGPCEEKNDRETIYPYAPMELGQKMAFTDEKYGKFQITAVHVARNDLHDYSVVILDIMRLQSEYEMKEYTECGETMSKIDKKEVFVRRQIRLLHVRDWDAFGTMSNSESSAKAVEQIAHQHKEQIRKRLPGLLIHCASGLQSSVGVAVCFLSRQMWLEKGLVHPIGILKYVRKHRYLALSTEMLPSTLVIQQLATISAVLQVICTTSLSADADFSNAGKAGGILFSTLKSLHD